MKYSKKSSFNAMLLVVGVVGTLAFTIGRATPASAVYLNCPNGVFCAWDGADGTGQPNWVFPISVYGPPGRCINLNNTASQNTGDRRWTSVTNRYGNYGGHKLWVEAWTDLNCQQLGNGLVIIQQGQARNLPDNNQIRSFMIVAV